MEVKPEMNDLKITTPANFDNKGGSVLGILEGPVADFLHPTRNERLYSDEVWENVWKDPLVKEMFKNGGIVGELDHPVDREEIDSTRIAIKMPEPPVKGKDGLYRGRFEQNGIHNSGRPRACDRCYADRKHEISERLGCAVLGGDSDGINTY